MVKFKRLFKKRRRRSKSLDDLHFLSTIHPQTPTSSIYQMKRQLQMKCNSFAEYSREKIRRLTRDKSTDSESIRAVYSADNMTLSDNEDGMSVCGVSGVTFHGRTSSIHLQLHLNNDIFRLRVVMGMFLFTSLYVVCAMPIIFRLM